MLNLVVQLLFIYAWQTLDNILRFWIISYIRKIRARRGKNYGQIIGFRNTIADVLEHKEEYPKNNWMFRAHHEQPLDHKIII